MSASGRVVAEADLAWPGRRIAVLTEVQAEDRSAFEDQGWRVFIYPVEGRSILDALRAEGA